MLIDMEEAHLSHDRERRRWKIAEETNEEREERLALEEKARRALARKKYSLRRAKETPNQIAARLSQQKSNLTDVEEILVGQVFPVISVYALPGGEYAYCANIINFPQRCAGVRGTTST
ncbi:15387_t:CDS:2 [Rhizophagus irregularis]|nr:15387_t:CDS:2 [Rhizophagus irregularis]